MSGIPGLEPLRGLGQRKEGRRFVDFTQAACGHLRVAHEEPCLSLPAQALEGWQVEHDVSHDHVMRIAKNPDFRRGVPLALEACGATFRPRPLQSGGTVVRDLAITDYPLPPSHPSLPSSLMRLVISLICAE